MLIFQASSAPVAPRTAGDRALLSDPTVPNDSNRPKRAHKQGSGKSHDQAHSKRSGSKKVIGDDTVPGSCGQGLDAPG